MAKSKNVQELKKTPELKEGQKVVIIEQEGSWTHGFKTGQIVEYLEINPYGGTDFKGLHEETGTVVVQWLTPDNYEIINN